MGKPIVTTDAVGAAYDLVKPRQNGYIVRNGDVDALYNAIKTLLSDDERIKTMGLNSRRIFEQFNDYGKMYDGFRNAISYAKKAYLC